MCGIAGILRIHLAGTPPPAHWVSIPEVWLDVLDESIRHRGPDGAGRFRDRATRPDGSVVDVAFVHRRLSIIDHAGGHQPMVSLEKGRGVLPVDTFALGDGLGLYTPGEYERIRIATVRERSQADDDLVAVAFNGCIYNHRELRKELQAAGHVFSTDHSDTEVLVHGWREWGEHTVEELEGMFAFAAWSRARASLLLARDWVGEKPLYMADWPPPGHVVSPTQSTSSLDDILHFDPLRGEPRIFAFGSGVPGLLRLSCILGDAPTGGDFLGSWIERGYDDDAAFAGSLTEIKGIVLLAGTTENGTPGTRQSRSFRPRWWNGDTNARRTAGKPLTPDDVERLLEAAVRLRLEADRPMASFLSGGIDSPLLTHFAQRALGNFQALTVRMPDARYDESDIAARLAGLIGVKHTIVDADPRPADDLVHLVHQLGLPFGDSSLLPSYWVSRAARREVAVALGGDGGDELFAGYERYVGAELSRRQSVQYLRHAPRWLFAGAGPKSRRAKLGRLARSLDPLDSDVGRIFSFKEVESLFPPGELPYALMCDGPGAFTSGAASLIDWDFCRYLPGDLLRKTDTASMSEALEVRAPFLDFDLMEAALCAPISVLMPAGQRKGLLRQVARKYFPADIVDRPKMGFAIPVGEWFRSDYGSMRTLLLDHLNSAEPFGPPSLGITLNMKFIRTMLKEHDDAGEASLFPWKGRDHSQRLYMLLVLSIWAKWMGGLRAG